ncbi:preprotein translocase subunit SecE [Maledivibacter halophilus]|uniref:Protein translocase subunit SecE n=1 Tax=Maledivibacter halophilus TaxID=36842 RepID=A0A1T5MXX7_9FIRM|nr:preprotein translocase subunit SecE [Maledivibacter halophilus]SKC92698.1 protein translocase subunit secE/sec61 gamma [Maledivibacter halophilus]
MAAQTNTKRMGARKYFKSVKSELKKVSWPNRKDLQSYTIVVLVACGLASIGIWLADSVFGQIIKLLAK